MDEKKNLSVAAAAFLFLTVFFVKPELGLGCASRLAAADSLAERNTWIIDESNYANHTLDKVVYQGHYYSTKPPGSALLGAVVQAVFSSLLSEETSPVEDEPLRIGGFEIYAHQQAPLSKSELFTVSATIFFTTTLAALGALVLFSKKVFQNPVLSDREKQSLIVALGFGTYFLTHSTALFANLTAGFLLFASFYCLLVHEQTGTKGSIAASGLFMGALANFELQSMVYAPFFLAYLLYKKNKKTLFYAFFLLIGTLSTLAYYSFVFGSPVPVYLRRELYIYPNTPWLEKGFWNDRGEPRLDYFLNTMFSPSNGYLLYSPILIVLFLGLGNFFFEKNPLDAPIQLGFLSLLLFYTFFTHDYGGQQIGSRWLLAPIALGFYSYSRIHKKLSENPFYSMLFYFLLTLSVAIMLLVLVSGGINDANPAKIRISQAVSRILNPV